MKKIAIGVTLALSVVGCSKKKPQENKEPPAPVEPTPAGTGSAGGSAVAVAEKPLVGKDLADKYMKCSNAIMSDIEAFKKDCVAPEYKAHEMDEGDYSGFDALAGMFASMKKAFPDFKNSPQLVLINGRNILAVNLSQGTNSGPLAMPGMPEMPASNKKVGTLFFHRLLIDDTNKAIEEWAYEDPTTFMGQIGALPPKAPAARPAIEKGWDGAPIVVVAADDDKEKKNLEVVKNLDDAFNTHKPDAMLPLMSDDFVESDQADAADHTGKKEAEAGLKKFMAAFPDAKVTADNRFAAGDYVVELGTFEGTNTGDMGPIKKTGKKVTMHYAEISKLKDGKVTNLWRFRNGMAMAMQLGLMQMPGGAGAGSAAAGSAAGSAAPKK
ncbi:MAG: ester cyclase [Deltaproteobacteria bacterium]|nr:ester cyclase [Deltaproteobacteria bacterium]